MLALTTWTGGLLVATGVIAYVATGAASFTALIPAAVGVLLLIAALIGRRSEKARKHAMHAGLAIALLGASRACVRSRRHAPRAESQASFRRLRRAP